MMDAFVNQMGVDARVIAPDDGKRRRYYRLTMRSDGITTHSYAADPS